MPEGPKPSPPLHASPITLGELANYNADEWRQLTTEALARSRFAAVALAAAKGDDVVDALGAVIGLLGRDSRCMVAHVLERQLAEVMVQGAPPDETQVSRARDILALLGSLNTPEALDAVSAVLDDKQKPLLLRLRAADALVSCGVRLPRQISAEVEDGTAGALIGPVLEEMRQQDPRRCLKFISSLKLDADERVSVEYPFRRAAIDVGLPDTVMLLGLTAPVMAGRMHQFFRDILAVAFGEDALVAALSEAVAITDLGKTGFTTSIISDEAHGALERDVSSIMRTSCGLVLQGVTAYATSLLPPKGNLLSGVQENLGEGVPYTFYVSAENIDKIYDYKKTFLDAVGPQQKYENLVTVVPYKESWAGNTLIFYFFGDPARPQEAYQGLLALLGSERDDTLPSSWELLSGRVGKSWLSNLAPPSITSKQDHLRELILQLREDSGDPVPIAVKPLLKITQS